MTVGASRAVLCLWVAVTLVQQLFSQSLRFRVDFSYGNGPTRHTPNAAHIAHVNKHGFSGPIAGRRPSRVVSQPRELLRNAPQHFVPGAQPAIIQILARENNITCILLSESVGGCSMYAVVYVRASEVVTANMQGHLKLWDLRAQQPAKATLLSPDQIAVCHLAGHPTQQHLVAAGGEDGAMAIWDMRNIAQPVTLISAHNGPITEVRFHPAAPDHLFTCGLDGQLLHWDASASARPTPVSFKGPRDPAGASITVWLSSDVARGAIDTTCIIPQSSLPINSLDIEGPTLVAGSDNESIYTVRNVLLY
nr:nucleoporin Nup43-like [Penaeus vannamei]